MQEAHWLRLAVLMTLELREMGRQGNAECSDLSVNGIGFDLSDFQNNRFDDVAKTGHAPPPSNSGIHSTGIRNVLHTCVLRRCIISVSEAMRHSQICRCTNSRHGQVAL